MLVFCTTERYSHAEFIIIHSGARMGCRIEATPLTITDILLNDYCITCNMYVHNYSPSPLTCASNYKIHFNCVIGVSTKSIAKFICKTGYLFERNCLCRIRPVWCTVFFHIIVILCGGCVKGMLMSLATNGLTVEPFFGRSA